MKSAQHIYSYPPGPDTPNHGGMIGVEGDQVEGEEIVIPACRINYHVKYPASYVNESWICQMARQVGKVNVDAWRNLSPGECLYMGMEGEESGGTAPVEITHSIACSENIIDQIVLGIGGVSKDGWDVAWVESKPGVSNGKPVRTPAYVHIERPYLRTSFANMFGF